MSSPSKQVAMINTWFKNPLVSGFFVAGQATNNGKLLSGLLCWLAHSWKFFFIILSMLSEQGPAN
jgi:hypothetical protein